MINKAFQELAIVAVTPHFLERGVLWFQEHEKEIRKAIVEQKGMWGSSAFLIKKGEIISPLQILRKISDLGYEKTSRIFGKGEYAHHGNIIEITPIHINEKVFIEFYGNVIEEITAIPFEYTSVKKIKKEREFVPGDYVVHLDHGIGIYRGIIMSMDQNAQIDKISEPIKFLKNKVSSGEVAHNINQITCSDNYYYVIEYAPLRNNGKPDILYVPLSQKKRIDFYIGFETPAIHRLGGGVWLRTKRKAREEIEKFAKELLALYGTRLQAKQIPLHPDDEFEKKIAESFPHEETPDQAKAINEVLNDLEKEKPMDRLLAGDVGFGKTEIAIRAIVRTIVNGHQALLLAPTTILVEEHFRSITERLSSLPICIKKLSRLTRAKDAYDIIDTFKKGLIDCVIGTHRLLSQDIFCVLEHTESLKRRVALLIIDEEQRFGVAQKEHFKKFRADINVLSISATPIPRTLSLSLSGIWDISIIQTPPEGRLPIQTFVLPYRNELVKNVIVKELERKGQVFFLHNRVSTLQMFKERVQTLVPQARIDYIHGRSSPETIFRVLKDFRERKIDVLAATTIIENGIDFPNANTLIVEDASRLGLSEAHQLRGRIGRGDKEAYAYFLYRSKHLTEKALLRLQALQEANSIGSGYELALKDLEIRGAGNVLGKEQSGVANKIGLNLYYHMLSEAVEKEKQAL